MFRTAIARPIMIVLLTVAFWGGALASADAAGVRPAAAAPAALSGTKTVCSTGGDYPSLREAFGNIAINGLDGPLTLELCASYRSNDEIVSPLQVPAFPGSSATNTVTVRPAADAIGLSISPTGANADAAIVLDNATYVIFDGRPGGVGASSELTIAHPTNRAIFFGGSAGPARHNTLRYLTITTGGWSAIAFANSGSSNNNVIEYCDISGSPTNTAVLVHNMSPDVASDNTIANNRLHRFTEAAIRLDNSSNGTITGNSIYQDAAGALAFAPQYGMDIDGGEGWVIHDNIIGGSQPDGGGAAWGFTTGNAYGFTGIALVAGEAAVNSIQGNSIANIAISTYSNQYQNLATFVGINVNGAANISGNTIGSATGTDSVYMDAQSQSADNYGNSYGIVGTSSTAVTIADNTVGAIRIYSQGSIRFAGIATAGAGDATIAGNLVGSLTTADSIQVGGGISLRLGGRLNGIESSSGGTVAITGNTVANLRNTYSGWADDGSSAGIRTLAGANTITGNTVRNLTTTSNTNSADHDAVLIGIAQTATTAGDQIVAQNVVHSLACEVSSSSGAVLYPYGIYFAAPAASTNLVSRNFVHSLAIVQSDYAIVYVTGIYGLGTGTYQNNVVRLGIDAQGAAVTRGYSTYGIRQAAAASFYFNTVYIGGASVRSLETTYAFYGSGDPLTLQNNLLFNARANSGSGAGLHYAAYFPAATGLTSDYNIFLACNGNGTLIREGATDRTLAAWQTASGQDGHSRSPSALAQVNFVNATGDAASLDLRVQSPTVVEAAGLAIPAVTDDYAGQTRAGLTPVDIGASAGDWGSVSPPPAINYTMLPTTTTELSGPTLSEVFIDAAAGVASAPGTRPRLYFKRSLDADTFNDNTAAGDGWKWVAASGSGGSPFDFTLDYSLLYGGNGVSGGDTVQYFVIAQTLAVPPGVGIADGVLGGAVAPASVALAADAFPLASTVNSYRILGVGGVKTVCATGCDFTSLTLADGLFAKINTAGLYSDVVAEIRGDLTAETGATALNQWTNVLGGPWTLTIRPAGGAARSISGSATTLIKLNGADRVIIDGLNSDGNSLRIGPSGAGSAIQFGSGASDNIVRNCTVEGASPLSKSTDSSTVILIDRNNTTGNNNNTIANNIIQWNGAAYSPPNLIRSAGLSLFANSGNTIANNTLRNFGKFLGGGQLGYGINIERAGNENWTISGNTIYEEERRGARLYGIYLSSEGVNTISGNTIRDMDSGPTVYGIYLGPGGATTVSRNRITLTTAGYGQAWHGIYYEGGNGMTTAVTLTNNAITISPSTSTSQALYGIYDNSYAGNALTAYHNSVYIGGTATGNATWAFLRTTSSADTVTLKNNLFFNDRTGGAVNHFAAGNQSAGGTFTADYNLFAGTGVTAASFMDWGTSSSGTPVDFATWQASSGGDSHSYADVAANIPVASLFTDAANGDLSIVTGSGFDAAPLPSNRGVGGLGVTEDFNDAPRSATRPDLGAFEFTVDRTGLAGPGTLAGGWGYYDTLDIASGAITAGGDINVVALTLAAGVTLDMGGHTLTVPGGGRARSNLQDVTGAADFTFLGPTGVVINPGGELPLGLTGVTIRFLPPGTLSCVGGGQTTVRRCFAIDATNTGGRSATVRFYFDENTDLNSLTCADLKAFHHDAGGDWSLAGGTGGAVTCNGALSYVEVTGVTDFSDFILAGSQPTAVMLRGVRAGRAAPWPALLIAAGALLVGLAAARFRTR